MTRRHRQMLTNKLYTILADLLDAILEGTVNRESEQRKSPDYYIESYLQCILIDEYYKDKDFKTINEYIRRLNSDDIRNAMFHLRNGNFKNAMTVLTDAIDIDNKDFANQYLKDITEQLSQKEVDVSAELERLKAENKELKLEIERLKKMTPTVRFTKDNITVDTIKSTKVVFRKGEYVQEYSNLDTLLDEEEITLAKPLSEIVSILKCQIGDKFRYFQTSKKGRIEFYFN